MGSNGSTLQVNAGNGGHNYLVQTKTAKGSIIAAGVMLPPAMMNGGP